MDWTTVTTAPNEPMGEVIAQLLRNNGIPAHVRTATLAVYAGSGITPVRVMVPDNREAESLALLAELTGPWDPDEPLE